MTVAASAQLGTLDHFTLSSLIMKIPTSFQILVHEMDLTIEAYLNHSATFSSLHISNRSGKLRMEPLGDSE